MEQLYIDGQEVDLPIDPITRKIQIADISDISKRNSSYSYTIKLPKTQRNLRIMQSVGAPGNTSNLPYNYVRAEYLVDNLPIVTDGRVVFQSTDDYISVNVIDGVIGFFEIFEDKKIADIPFGDGGMIPTNEAYINGNDFLKFALADFGYYAEEVGYDISFIPQPLLNFRALLEKIYLIYNLYNFPSPDTLVAPDVFLLPTKGVPFRAINYRSDYVQIYYFNQITSVAGDNLRELEIYSFYGGNSYLQKTSDGYLYATITGTYSLEFQVKLYSKDVDYYVIQTKYVNREWVDEAFVKNEDDKRVKVILELGITTAVRVLAKLNTPIGTTSAFGVQINNAEFASGGIKVTEAFGDIPIVDLMKDIFSLNGIVVHPESIKAKKMLLGEKNNGQNFKGARISSILKGDLGTLNYTDKLVSVTRESYECDLAQNNHFRYTGDDSAYTDILISNTQTKGNLKIDNLNLPFADDLYTSIFEMQPNETTFSPWYTRPFPLSGIDLVSYDGSNTATIEYKEISPRICTIYQMPSSMPSWTANVPGFGTLSIPENATTQLYFSPSLQYPVNDNFAEYKMAMDRFKKIEVVLDLTLLDIYNLDFFKLIYFQQLGAYYYISNVQYTHGELSKCELIEIKR